MKPGNNPINIQKNKNMNKFLKWVLIVNIAILVVVVVKLIFFDSKNGGWTPPPLIDNSEEIAIEAEKIKASEAVIDSLEAIIVDKKNLIDAKDKSLTKLKKDYETKKHSVSVLPADESISVFAEYINKERNKPTY